MQTSADGIATLKHHEGDVLKAYRCPAGRWTIGVGLTSASGVVTPKAGMVITRDQSTRLLQEALRRNYEPAVVTAMPSARQHEFDAGVSFHFNTGAIRKATWVKNWRAKATSAVIRAGLMAWTKGGGKVLPGLVRRREDEAGMLLEGKYPVTASKATIATPDRDLARDRAVWGLDMNLVKRANVGAALHALGYAPYGPALRGDFISAEAVKAFQRDHDLTVDGIIGRATLSTLQRRLDAAEKAKPAAAAPVAAATLPATGGADALSLPPALDWIILALAVGYALWLALAYRDAIAAKITHRMPRLAAFLRSF